MPVVMTCTPVKGVPTSIPGDTAPQGELVPTYLPSIFNAVEVEFDIKFEYQEGTVTCEVTQVVIDSAPDIEGLVFTVKGADTVSVKGTPVNVFKDEIFRFLFADGTEKNLPPTNTEDWDTIIKWAPPSKQLETVEYKFTVDYSGDITALPPIEDGSASASISQNIFWKYEPSLDHFNLLLLKGKY